MQNAGKCRQDDGILSGRETQRLKKLNGTVKKELRYILSGVLFFSAVMELVLLLFSALGLFGYRYGIFSLLSCLYTDLVMVADFFLLCLTLQKIVNMEDPNRAKLKLRSSSSVRSLAKVALIGAGAYFVFYKFTDRSLPDLLALLLPVFFPRITIAFRSLVLKKQGK